MTELMTESQGVILRGALLVAISLLAISSELRTRRIPNAVTLGGLVAALFVAGFTGHFVDALGGLVVVAVPFLFAFWQRLLPGGAVKLALALSASVGLVGALVIVGGPVLVYGFGRVFAMRDPSPIGTKINPPLLAWFAVLGFAMSAAKLLAE